MTEIANSKQYDLEKRTLKTLVKNFARINRAVAYIFCYY